MNTRRQWIKMGCACLFAYCLVYGALRSSHVLVHRWREIIKPGEVNGQQGVTYWIINDVGYGTYLDSASLRPKNDARDRFLKYCFFPLAEAEGLFWTLNMRIRFGGGVWFYTSEQRRELKRVLSGHYGHNITEDQPASLNR